MNITICTVAGGNATILYSDIPDRDKLNLAIRSLVLAEQVGFVDQMGQTDTYRFSMMGGELSVNGTIAACMAIPPGSSLKIPGQVTPVNFTKQADNCLLDLSLPFTRNGNTVLFESIGYLLVNNKIPITKEYADMKCEQYGLPAFGFLRSNGNTMYPTVYVKNTGSLVRETACGSGSIAFSLLTGYTEIRQPTGKIIYINRKKNVFSVRAQVRKFSYEMALYKPDSPDTILGENI